jgi:hypothetical protein
MTKQYKKKKHQQTVLLSPCLSQSFPPLHPPHPQRTTQMLYLSDPPTNGYSAETQNTEIFQKILIRTNMLWALSIVLLLSPGAGIAQSVQRLATGWTPCGRSSSSSRVKIILFSRSSRPPLRSSQPPGIKRLECEAYHSPPTTAKAKKMWVYTSTPPYAFVA